MARIVFFLVLLLGMAAPAAAEDGYDLWLRYRPLPAASAPHMGAVVAQGASPTIAIALAELRRELAGLSGGNAGAEGAAGPSVLLGTPTDTPAIAALRLPLAALGDEGYLIRTVPVAGRTTIVVAANRDIGVLYGAFALLRLAQTAQPLGVIDVASAPKLKLRVLNHWDNLDGTVERGYAGQSIWDWWTLPDWKGPALRRLRARQRLDRHQRHGAQQRQCQGGQPDRAVYRQGGGAGRRVPALWHQGLSVRALLRADRDSAG